MGWGLREMLSDKDMAPRKGLTHERQQEVEDKIQDSVESPRLGGHLDDYLPSYELASYGSQPLRLCSQCQNPVTGDERLCKSCKSSLNYISDLQQPLLVTSLNELVEAPIIQLLNCKQCGGALVKAGKFRRCPDCDTYCGECGALVGENAKRCQKCGIEFEEGGVPICECGEPKSKFKGFWHCGMCDSYCENCGAVVGDDAIRCPNCRQPFE